MISPLYQNASTSQLLDTSPQGLISSRNVYSIACCEKKYKYEQILLNQKLPGELEIDSTTAISSFSFFVEGKKQRTNPSEKMTRRRRQHKLMET